MDLNLREIGLGSSPMELGILEVTSGIQLWRSVMKVNFLHIRYGNLGQRDWPYEAWPWELSKLDIMFRCSAF